MKTNKKVISSLMWRFAERSGAQSVRLLIELILARLLLPEDYGLIALVTVFIQILNVFVDSGLGNALIQKKDADDLDFSSVFYFNLIWCLFLYAFLFLVAPIFASFYKKTELSNVLRILGLQIIISGVKNVQQAYVSKTMQFKRFFFATIGGTLGAAIIGVFMAYQSFGVWALVLQQLFNVIVDTSILWVTVKWRPKKMFSLKRLGKLFSYGWKLMLSSLIDTVYSEIRQLIIGKIYTSSDLAYYNRGQQFPNIIVSNIDTSIDSVLLPTMSNEQDNKERIRNMTRMAIKISTYIMAPLMIGLACTAESIVSLILTDKWLPCVFYLRIFSITFMFYPIHTANLNAIKAMGKSDLFLKIEVCKKIIGIIALVSTMWISVAAIACSLLVISVVNQVINSWPNRKLLNYHYLDQIKDILPGIGLAVFMGICVYLIGYMPFSTAFVFIIQVILGASIYLIGSIIFKIDSFQYIWSIVKSIFLERRK